MIITTAEALGVKRSFFFETTSQQDAKVLIGTLRPLVFGLLGT
jgi:hypothetical protein